MRIVRGKRVLEIGAQELSALRGDRSSVLLDVGTGDGRFVSRWARSHPDTFCIGLDPVSEAMREMSQKATRKPARGGLSNVLFVVASIEQPPTELLNLADRLFVNYPWGSLLGAFVVPDRHALATILSFGKQGTELTVLLNCSVFEDPSYMDRLNLPPFGLEAVDDRLAPVLNELGAEILDRDIPTGPVPYPTSWERRLVAGSRRKTLRIEARIQQKRE